MLNLTHIDLRFRATRAVRLPEHSGSAWRGAFGHALRRAVCITGKPVCDDCPVRDSCTYTEVFETRPPKDDSFLSRYTDAPHPYLIASAPQTALTAGEAATIRLSLIGRGARHARVVAEALSRAAAQVGRAGDLEALDFELHPLAQLPPAAAVPTSARVVLESSLRLRVQDRYWMPVDFCFAPFFSTLLRRLTQLCAVHGEIRPQVDARALMDAARQIELSAVDLSWQPLARYSSRQKRKIPLGGLLGSFQIHGDLTPLWPWLWAGQYLHVGKGTAMGLGRYRIESLMPGSGGVDGPGDCATPSS